MCLFYKQHLLVETLVTRTVWDICFPEIHVFILDFASVGDYE